MLRGHTLQVDCYGGKPGVIQSECPCVSPVSQDAHAHRFVEHLSHQEYEDDQGNLKKRSVLYIIRFQKLFASICSGIEGLNSALIARLVSNSVRFESLTQINVYRDFGLYSDIPKLSMVSDEYYLADGFDRSDN